MGDVVIRISKFTKYCDSWGFRVGRVRNFRFLVYCEVRVKLEYNHTVVASFRLIIFDESILF